MRSFIVAFMVLILISSIILVFVFPVHKTETHAKKAEKTYVEKLLTGTLQEMQKENTEGADSLSVNNDKKTDVYSEYFYVPSESFNNGNSNGKELSNKADFSQNSSLDKNTSDVLRHAADYANSNESYRRVSKELSEKYGNNPNAQVSEEDMVKYTVKMLQSVQNSR